MPQQKEIKMKRILKTDDLAKLTVADAAAAWQVQSEGLDYRHPSFPYVFHAQYNSSVRKYLTKAIDLLVGKDNVTSDPSPAD